MPAIEIKDLEKKYKDKVAVNKISFVINDGELFSLLGVNGAGKTTTIKMLSCLTKPTSGDALIFGNSIIDNPYEVKRLISISPQETAIAGNLTVKENLDFIAGIYQVKDEKSKVGKILKELNLDKVLSQKTKTLSGGYQRRLSIAMALITEPKVLYLDEPTLGLDVIARRELWDVIKSLKGKITIILTTHYMEEAENLSDRVAIMSNGKINIIDTPKNIIKASCSKTFEDAFIEFAKEVK